MMGKRGRCKPDDPPETENKSDFVLHLVSRVEVSKFRLDHHTFTSPAGNRFMTDRSGFQFHAVFE